MPLYRYTVEDKAGRTLNGVMQALDESDLAQRLNSLGYTLRAAVAAGAPVPSASAAVASAPRAGLPATVTGLDAPDIPPSVEPRISVRTLASFLRQMATLIRSGMSAYQAITWMLSRPCSRRLRRALQDMESQVQSGGALSPTMAAHPDIFPTRIVGLVYCGELGGFLDTALDEAANNIEEEAKARLWPRIVYGFMRLNIISAFVTLPAVRADVWMDKLLNTNMSVSDRLAYLTQFYVRGLLRVALPLTIVFLIATYTWPHIKRIPSVRSALDQMLLRVPIWGAYHKSRSLSSFSTWLARLYAAGVSPALAWVAASYTCANSILANKLRLVGKPLASGGTVSDSLSKSHVFDTDTASLIMAGEQAGDIPGVLQKVAEFNDGVVIAQRAHGRWISASLTVSSLIAMSGVLFLMFWAGYAKVLNGLIEQIGGK